MYGRRRHVRASLVLLYTNLSDKNCVAMYFVDLPLEILVSCMNRSEGGVLFMEVS